MSEEEQKAVPVQELRMISLEEIVDLARIMKDEIQAHIRYGRILPQDVPQTLLNWHIKVMQLIRQCMTQHQVSKVLASSDPELELPRGFEQRDLVSAVAMHK